VIDLERIGEEASKIAKLVRDLLNKSDSNATN